ncbi:hypothetical protein BB561_002681 [Smittium simulii]|uniref:Histone-binding protein RBBP4-like N-terminal domain-containing protein n=1 Tax=Smittium simulii TaxID=133385 RepID=A0A2T9YPI2_9FUNG|nr:hypothetical protein BB561_002681 [Smittium simulii]
MIKRTLSTENLSNDVEMNSGAQSSTLENSKKLSKTAHTVTQANEVGEFEDIFEDEIESEDMIEEESDSGSDFEDDMQVDQLEDIQEETEQVYLPGDKLAEGETLEVDNSAYQMLHNLQVKWPCLSFDIVTDQLGENRTKFPHTMTIFTGSQADSSYKNEVYLMKMSQLHRTINDNVDEEESDNEEDLDEDPTLETRTFKHRGCVNRARVSKSNTNILGSTWSDDGKVYIWDLNNAMKSLETSTYSDTTKTFSHVINNHSDEGYALDWQSNKNLLSGGCDKKIFLSKVRDDGGITTNTTPFNQHKSSVEDLQWSPEEEFVFASCSADRSIMIWDIRQKQKKSALHVPNAHNSDVNVISWNQKSRYLLASGDDNGLFSIWDLRTWDLKNKIMPVATMDWHKSAITSIEWNPLDDSVLAVSGADDQLTIWDLSVELDHEDQKSHASAFTGPDGQQRQVPPQLLFIHQGQNDIKELHWSKQVPGSVVSTSLSGFNVFKTISV